ncbi:hypothetical protein GCM10010441_39380 [Kitasatospora paracochleata]|uniref:Uncharacterized protein n=1 Tax=Kitasatospora paracochleata TaxID=58354 RepID=A0ABT1J9V3_9ACTN|nr:hypothetical protein [Kitasatospora paracochleata]MCP2314240.1 hypothetical protein [Kitasatospora paracochleata]
MTDTTTPTTPAPTAARPGAQRHPADTGTSTPSSPRVLVLDPGALADPAEREQAFVQLLRYQAQVLTSHVRLEEGDRVELLEPVRASWIDEDLADEEYWEEDARVHINVPAGTLGVITRVRRYPTPFPYVVAFDRGPECGVRNHQISRCADQSLTPAAPPDPAPEPWRR